MNNKEAYSQKSDKPKRVKGNPKKQRELKNVIEQKDKH